MADAAFVWLPIDAAEIETAVLATERRFVAISARRHSPPPGGSSPCSAP